MRVFVINGPNLNLLGTRETTIYGSDNLADIIENCKQVAKQSHIEIEFFQSNHEGQIVDWVQSAINNADAIIINAGAYTHTSIAIHDAVKAYNGYKIELHISNPYARETFRHHSYLSPVVDSVVAGMGAKGYENVIKMLPSLVCRH